MNEIANLQPPANEVAPLGVPHSIEAEQQLLGALLTNNYLFDRVAQIFRA